MPSGGIWIFPRFFIRKFNHVQLLTVKHWRNARPNADQRFSFLFGFTCLCFLCGCCCCFSFLYRSVFCCSKSEHMFFWLSSMFRLGLCDSSGSIELCKYDFHSKWMRWLRAPEWNFNHCKLFWWETNNKQQQKHQIFFLALSFQKERLMIASMIALSEFRRKKAWFELRVIGPEIGGQYSFSVQWILIGSQYVEFPTDLTRKLIESFDSIKFHANCRRNQRMNLRQSQYANAIKLPAVDAPIHPPFLIHSTPTPIRSTHSNVYFYCFNFQSNFIYISFVVIWIEIMLWFCI